METAIARQRKSVYQFQNFINGNGLDIDQIVSGLKNSNKYIVPKFLYDEIGRRLFDALSATKDYYLTRAEIEILAENADEMAEVIGTHSILVEPSCGNFTKAEYLFANLKPDRYVMVDAAEQPMQSAARRLVYRYPGLSCMAVAADSYDFSLLNDQLPTLNRVVFYPGSAIGQFEPDDAIDILRKIKGFVGVGGGLLIGVDLEKDATVLNRAYNDLDGVTAEFNLNILNNVNRIIGSNFSQSDFYHHAYYDSRKRRVEMHLCSERKHTIMVGDHSISIAEGESIHTGNSYKYSAESFSALAAEAGFLCARTWFDSNNLFSVQYFVAAEDRAHGANQLSLSELLRRRH